MNYTLESANIIMQSLSSDIEVKLKNVKNEYYQNEENKILRDNITKEVNDTLSFIKNLSTISDKVNICGYNLIYLQNDFERAITYIMDSNLKINLCFKNNYVQRRIKAIIMTLETTTPFSTIQDLVNNFDYNSVLLDTNI